MKRGFGRTGRLRWGRGSDARLHVPGVQTGQPVAQFGYPLAQNSQLFILICNALFELDDPRFLSVNALRNSLAGEGSVAI